MRRLRRDCVPETLLSNCCKKVRAVVSTAVHTAFQKLLHHSIHMWSLSLLSLLPNSRCVELGECLRGVMGSVLDAKYQLCIHILNPCHVSWLH